MTDPVILETGTAALQPMMRGKVRDMYDLGDRRLIVATDRLSAFDVVLPDGIPFKGKVLTQISAFWFRRLATIMPNHFISVDTADLPAEFRNDPRQFEGRSMLVRSAQPLPVECVVRGYLSGSGWNDYRTTGKICGLRLPAGLHESDQLPEPLFTPSSKAERGLHDENITFDDVVRLVGGTRAEELRAVTLRLYAEGAAFARTRDILIADTKFEFGVAPDGSLLWIDEALTPDSSRFWPKDGYQPGRAQPSYDKQFVRDYLTSVSWDRRAPGPRLPHEVIATTSAKYVEVLRLLTGRELATPSPS